jgi:hypothetical protein
LISSAMSMRRGDSEPPAEFVDTRNVSKYP